jgi:hypothetical protein
MRHLTSPRPKRVRFWDESQSHPILSLLSGSNSCDLSQLYLSINPSPTPDPTVLCGLIFSGLRLPYMHRGDSLLARVILEGISALGTWESLCREAATISFTGHPNQVECLCPSLVHRSRSADMAFLTRTSVHSDKVVLRAHLKACFLCLGAQPLMQTCASPTPQPAPHNSCLPLGAETEAQRDRVPLPGFAVSDLGSDTEPAKARAGVLSHLCVPYSSNLLPPNQTRTPTAYLLLLAPACSPHLSLSSRCRGQNPGPPASCSLLSPQA